MSRQNISIGTTANDGTGDTLRSAGTKINANFAEIYEHLSGDSAALSSKIFMEDSSIVFEGVSADDYETRLHVVNPTVDRSIQLPNADGIITLNTATQTLTNKILLSPSLTTPSITTSINDVNNNEIIKLSPSGAPVNEISVMNADSGDNPQINATGTNTNINLNLNAKGTGSVEISKAAYESIEINANGTVSPLATYIICNKATALGVSLPDGTTIGEFKIFTNKGAGVATINPTNFANGSNFAISQNEGAMCIWDGSNWYLVGNQSITTVT